MPYTTEGIRNVALAGHAGAGKTTLFEALLYAGGAIQTVGSVERGTTVSDHDAIEKERRHSIAASIASIELGDVHVNRSTRPATRTSAARRCPRSPRSRPARSSSTRRPASRTRRGA